MFKNLPWAAKYTVPPLVVALLLVMVFFSPETVKLTLTFERELIIQGQWWRLVTGQWVHWGLGHVVMNVAGVWLVWLLFAEYASGWRYGVVIVFIAVASNLGMFWFDPKVEYYVGFSGTLYGLFAWGGVQDIRHKVPFGWLLLVAVVAKVVYDLMFGAVSITGVSADNLAVAAHFYGVVGGVMIGLVSNNRWLPDC